MAKKFRNLVEQMPTERCQRIEEQTRQLMAEMPLQELRKALQLTQQQVTTTLSMNQASVSKMKGQTDMYANTLRCVIEAMGGKLQIVAQCPQEDVEINQLSERKEETEKTSPA